MIAPLETEGIETMIEKGYVPCGYGGKVSSPVVKFSKDSSTPTNSSTPVYPYRGILRLRILLKKPKEMLQ